jgi:hypothetical protein
MRNTRHTQINGIQQSAQTNLKLTIERAVSSMRAQEQNCGPSKNKIGVGKKVLPRRAKAVHFARTAVVQNKAPWCGLHSERKQCKR